MWTNVFNSVANFAMRVATDGTTTNIGQDLANQLKTAIEGIDFTVLYQPFIMLLPICLGIGCAFAGLKKGLGLLFSTINRA